MVASLGGFLGRKSDGEPGTQTLWLGLQRLDDITEMWKISISYLCTSSTFTPSISPSPGVQKLNVGKDKFLKGEMGGVLKWGKIIIRRK
jgi:hypothetical protein